jgi:hypothetical protein
MEDEISKGLIGEPQIYDVDDHQRIKKAPNKLRGF